MTAGGHPGDPFGIPGRWYKGNLHTHSTNSDGAKSPADAVAWYQDQGYDFLALTDHRVLTDTSGFRRADFLTIPGMELHGPDPTTGENYHIVGLGITSFERSNDAWLREEAIARVNGDGGIAFMGHPYWLGQTAAHLQGLTGFVGLEVFNSVCDVHRAKGFSNETWDAYLLEQGLTWGLATDDSHWKYAEEGRGWVMVRASDLSVVGVLAALRKGHFYSTMGPAFEDVRFDGSQVIVRCAPVRRISVMAARAKGANARAPAGGALTELVHPLKGVERYVRIEIEDHQGRVAWTNPRAL
ncbi:MAG: CehA/McbA family metallohydrolase [Actinobacteria bacterium]|nr:CehA/McbA family metallohydrolase [Actinomycetota bacterium]